MMILLQEILEEIEEERQKQALSREELLVEAEEDDSGVVLVACKDEHSCMQLEECILNSPKKVFPTFFSHLLDSHLFFRGIIFTLSHTWL
jgi:DNA excision repair protein ERCC-4